MNDSAYKGVILGNLEQAAIQFEGGSVVLSEPDLIDGGASLVESVLAHELLLDYMGI